MKKNKSTILAWVFLSFAIIFSMQFIIAAQSAVNLGTAGDFVVLSKSGISTTGTTSIVGDIGVSPIGSTAITGFNLIGVITTDTFLTSSLVTGKVYAANLVSPTPSKMTTAISDMQIAYTDAAGRTLPDYTETGSGNIGGMTLTPGLYKWGTGVIIPTDVTLNCQGDANAVFIFQIAQNLDVSNGKKVILIGDCQPANIFWQVGGQTTLGTNSIFNGNILDQTKIAIQTGATLNGRALAQTAVTLDANSVSIPALVIVVPSQNNTITLLSAENKTAGTTNKGTITFNSVSFDLPNSTSISNGTYAISFAPSSGLNFSRWNATGGINVSSVFLKNTNATVTGNGTLTAIYYNTTTSPPPVLTTITLLPTTNNLTVGSTKQLNATGFDQYNNSIATIINYTTSNSSVATVSSSGLVTAVGFGNSIITARNGSVNSTSIINVQTVAPILNLIGSKSVTQGTLLNFVITATNPSGLNLTFAITGKPATANFTDNHNNTAVFRWTPDLSNVGATNVNFTVTDGIKSASEMITINVNEFQAPTTVSTNPGDVWKKTDYNVTLNATGFNNTSIAYINYSLNNISGKINGSSGNVLINTSGNNTLIFYAVDGSGNVETQNTIYALLDKISPNITSFTLSATSVDTEDEIVGTCIVTDNLSTNITGVITDIDTTTAGTKTATCTATDLAGNIATASVIYVVNGVSTGSSHNGGGGSYCSTQWACAVWSACANGLQTRTCSYPPNYCTPRAERPVESQSCTASASTNEETTIQTTESATRTPGITGGVIGAWNTPNGKVGIIIFIGLLILGIILLLVKIFQVKKI